MAIVLDCVIQVSVLLKFLGRIKIGFGRTGGAFGSGCNEVFRAAVSGGLKVFAIAPGVVEPLISGQLLAAIAPVFQPLPDGLIGERILERSSGLRRGIIEVES